VWNDVRDAVALRKYDAVYCTKQIGVVWPGTFQVWASLHPEYMDKYEAERKSLGLPNGYEIVAPLSTEVGMHGKKGNISRRVTYRWPGMTGSASSGIYAAKVALDDSYKCVLAGVPMNKESGHFMPETKNVQNQIRGHVWQARDSFMPGFEIAVPFLKDRVKSMSGHTRDVLGYPTLEFLEN
jgi:hypothetical protein